MNKQAEAKLKKLKRDEEIVKLYNSGITIKDMVKQLSASESTIFRVLKAHDIALKDNKHFKEETIQHAIKLYEDESNTINHILSTTGIKSEQTLYRYLNERNVTLRKK